MGHFLPARARFWCRTVRVFLQLFCTPFAVLLLFSSFRLTICVVCACELTLWWFWLFIRSWRSCAHAAPRDKTLAFSEQLRWCTDPPPWGWAVLDYFGIVIVKYESTFSAHSLSIVCAVLYLRCKTPERFQLVGWCLSARCYTMRRYWITSKMCDSKNGTAATKNYVLVYTDCLCRGWWRVCALE